MASKTAKTVISSSEDDIVTAQSIDAANIETVSSSDSDSDDDTDDTFDFDTDGVKIQSGKGKKSKKKISISEIMADRSLTLNDKHESSSTDSDVADEPGGKVQANKKVVRRSKGSTPTKNKPISGKSQRQTTTSRGRTSSGGGKKVTQSKNAKETVQTHQTSQRTGKGKATGQPQNAGKQIFTGAQARKRILSSGSEDSDSNCVDGDIPLSQLPNSSSKTKQNLNTEEATSAATQNKRRKVEQPDAPKSKSKVLQVKSHQSASVVEKPDSSRNKDSSICKAVCDAKVTGVKDSLEKRRHLDTNQGENNLVTGVSICDKINAKSVQDSTTAKDVQNQAAELFTEELLPGNSPNANETLPSDLTSSSDKLIINEETSPAVTPTSSPVPSSVLGSSLLPQDKTSVSELSPKVAEKKTNEIIGESQVTRTSVNVSDKKDKKDLSTVCSQKGKTDDKKEHEGNTSTGTKVTATLEGPQSRKLRDSKDAKNSHVPGKLSNISNTETVSKMTLRRDTRQSAKAKKAENSSSKDSKSAKNKQISSACSDTSSDETDSESSTSQDETCESEKPKNVKSGTFVQGSKSVQCDQTSSKPAVETGRKSSQEETIDAAKPESIQSKKSSQDSKCAKDSQVSSKSNVRKRQSSTEEEKTRETENTGGQRKNSARKETQTKCKDAKKLKLCKDNETKGASEKRQIESKKETEGDKSTTEKRRTRSQSKSNQEEKDNKNKPSKSSKSGAKDKVNQTKKGAQPEISKSLRTYREIYSSTDEDSSDDDEIADDKNQKVTDKPASETVKETSKPAAKEKVEAKGKSGSKNKTPSRTTPSTTIIAKSSESSKKGSLGSYRIPKKASATAKTNDRKPPASEENKNLTTNSDKICDASIKDVPQQSGSSTPKASGKLTSPLLTTTKVSPLHMTSTCQLSPGMMNLLPGTSHQQEPMKSVGFTTSSPVATTTRGNKGEHSLSDLLSRCEEVFSNKSVEDKERTNQNNETPDLERPPEVTRLLDASRGHANQGPQLPALPSVLTGLLAQTAQASSIPQTKGISLPPALASLLPGGAVLKSATPEPTSSSSLPQPLAKLMEPLANTVDKTTSSEPLAALAPEFARLLPPGVRSVSPTPSQSMGVNYLQRDLPESALTESASERVDVKQDKPTKPTAIDKIKISATQSQDKSAEKIPEVESQQNVERKKSRPSGVQQSSSERKKPVVPEKRKVTYKGLSDEERLAAYINSGDRNNVEQRKSQKVDKQESNRRKKTSRKERGKNQRSSKDVKAYEDFDKLHSEAELDEQQRGDQDETMESDQQSQEEFENKVHLSAIDKRSQELNTKVEDRRCPLHSAQTPFEQYDFRQNRREHHGEIEVEDINPDLTAQQRSLVDNDGEHIGLKQESTERKGVTTLVQATDDQSNIKPQINLSPRGNKEVPQRRRSVKTAEHVSVDSNQQGALGSKPEVRRRSSECDSTTHSISGGSRPKLSSPTNLLPPPRILPDHMITQIPLENSRNAFDVHHHDMHNDPRIKRCLDSESIYSAGYEMPYALKLLRYVHRTNRSVSEVPKGAAKDPRLARVREKKTSNSSEERVQPREMIEKLELAGSVSGEEAKISQNFVNSRPDSTEPSLSQETLQNSGPPESASGEEAKMSQNFVDSHPAGVMEEEKGPPRSSSGEAKISQNFVESHPAGLLEEEKGPPRSSSGEAKILQNFVESQPAGVMEEKEANKLLCPEDLMPSKTSPTERSVSESMDISTRAEELTTSSVDGNVSVPMKSIETKMKETLINAPVDEAQFKTVVKASSFDRGSCRESGRASPEAKWIDPRLIRHVASVVKPTPMHRVVVGPPVIKAITTRQPLIKSPTKSKQAGKEAQVI